MPKGSSVRDENYAIAIMASNLLGTSPIYLTGVNLTDAHALHVAIVDGNGDQVTSFGGGTQYTDGGVPPAHPVGNTIEWSDGSFWQTVSTAKPLPISGAVDTELPAAAALADNTVNPTVPSVGALPMLWDATNTKWNRLLSANSAHGTVANGLLGMGLMAGEVGGVGTQLAQSTMPKMPPVVEGQDLKWQDLTSRLMEAHGTEQELLPMLLIQLVQVSRL
jgi:hypothetical protein